MPGNWQILKTETYQVVGWFYAGQLADSKKQKHIRWLDGSMPGNWQILKTETYQVVGWFYARQLADSENRIISGGWMVLCWATGRF